MARGCVGCLWTMGAVYSHVVPAAGALRDRVGPLGAWHGSAGCESAPTSSMMRDNTTVIRRLCVFCGSSPGHDPRYLATARAVGERLARAGLGIVYGGGRVGLMGALADAALAAGGEVIGVIPHALAARELAHQGLTALHVVATMHERKARMSELADAFLVLPGGLGTLEELFEVWSWAQLGVHRKPCGVLDVAGYWQPLLALVEHLNNGDSSPL